MEREDFNNSKKLSRKTHDTNKHFQFILENAPDAVFIHNHKGEILETNEMASKNLGFTKDEIIAMNVMDIDANFPELSVLQQEWNKLETEDKIKLFGTHLRKDGSSFPVEVHLSGFELDNEKLLVAFVRDITDKKRNDVALALSEERYRSLFTNMYNGFALHEMVFNESGKPVDYIFLDINQAFEKQTGLIKEDILGKRVTQVIPGIERDSIDWIGIYGEVVLSGESKTLINYSKPLKRWYSVMVYCPNAGQFATIFNDITDQKQVEESLRLNEQKLRTLFGAMTEMVVLHELVFDDNNKVVDYRITDCNKAFSDTTGIKKKDALGKLASELYGIDEAPYLIEYSHVAISGETYDFVTYYEPMDKHFMISVVSPAKNQFATITTDITAIQQIRDVVEAKNKELENYLFIASHDLRSPLVNIQGFSRMLQDHMDMLSGILTDESFKNKKKESLDTLFKEDIPKTLNFIFTGVAKIDKLINGLLQISRTGRIEMYVSNIDMNLLLTDVLSALNYQIEEMGVKIDMAELPNCFGDMNLLNQLFSNILSNSIKYRHPDRQLSLTISGKNQYNRIVYTIQDNGIGIAKRHLEKIWDVFFQVNPAKTDSGDGIGLSIVKRIIDKHRGKIKVTSAEGEGTTFNIELLGYDFLKDNGK